MTTDDANDADGSRTAAVRTTHADAGLVADALAPDNTDAMAMCVDDDAIACRIERPTTGGLRATVDDYVVNLRVADRVAERARAHQRPGASDAEKPDGDATDATDTPPTDTESNT